jgi:hypothetical protein
MSVQKRPAVTADETVSSSALKRFDAVRTSTQIRQRCQGGQRIGSAPMKAATLVAGLLLLAPPFALAQNQLFEGI